MVLTPQQAIDACYQGGFRFNHGIIIMPCVGWAESRLKTDARNVNPDGSVDRGWLQINDRAHPDVSDAEADDPVLAAAAAYSISSQGTNFRPWSAYNSGAYKGPESLVWLLFTEAWNRYDLGNANAELTRQLSLAKAREDALNAKIDLAIKDLQS